MKTILSGVFFLIFSISCFASGIDGNWATHMKAPDGTVIEISFAFKTDSAKLTGVVKLPNGDFEIANSYIKGKDFSFDITVNDTTITSNCTLNDDDSINMKVDALQFGELDMILKRKK
jgi:hypothetical protein